MTFVKRVCKGCGCDTLSMTDCGRVNDCDHASDGVLHDHCKDHNCTWAGCMAEVVPLGDGRGA